MKLLLDTCSVLWWRSRPSRLSEKLREIIAREPKIFVSAVTGYEISLKQQLGKLKLAIPGRDLIEDFLSYPNIHPLPVTSEHAVLAGELPLHHKDPFDRLLAAQSITEGLPLATPDQAFKAYQVEIFW